MSSDLPQSFPLTKVQKYAVRTMLQQQQAAFQQLVNDVREELGVPDGAPYQFINTPDGLDISQLVLPRGAPDPDNGHPEEPSEAT